MIRGSRAAVIWPKVLLVEFESRVSMRKLLVRLNASARNSTRCVSLSLKFLDSATSNCHVAGPRMAPWPRLPRVVVRNYFGSFRKYADFNDLVESSHAIISARYSDDLRRFPGRINLYKTVFQAHGCPRGRESVSAQTTRPLCRAERKDAPAH